MLPVTGYEDFRGKFERVADLRQLFVFILFDEPGKKIVANFVDDNFDWLDRLAAASNVFGFAFVHRDHESEMVANPSLQVAELFGIRPRELPGVVVFSMLPDGEQVADAAFLPLEKQLFESDLRALESFFADLFSIIQDAQDSVGDGESALEAFRKCIHAEERERRWGNVQEYIRARLQDIASMPSTFIDSMAQAFAKEATLRMMGPGG